METLEEKGYKISEPTADDVLQEERKEAGQMAAAATGMPEYKSAADFDARFSEMLRADEEKERARKEKEIQRKQIAQSMSDLGAVFGDVIKASGGALVTPRDVQAKYDALDKQTQTVYDNYRARMDAMRKGLQDNAAKDRDRALKAKEDAEAWERQLALYMQKRAAEAAEKAAERKWKEEEAEKDRKGREKAAYIRATGKKTADNVYHELTLNDGRVIQTTKANDTSRMRTMLQYMIQNGMVDVNNDAYYKQLVQSRLIKKDNGEFAFEKENAPLVISQLSDKDILETISHYLYFLTEEQNNALFDTFGQKVIPRKQTTAATQQTSTQAADTTATTAQQPKQTSTGGLY